MDNSWQILQFPEFKDIRGSLIPFELDASFPFPVKRVYLVTGNEGHVRGAHAHIQEQEVFVCVNGSVEMYVHDGQKEQTIILNKKNKGVLVPTQCWHAFQNFSNNAVLLCFSSTHYLPGTENYITDKNLFLNRHNS